MRQIFPCGVCGKQHRERSGVERGLLSDRSPLGSGVLVAPAETADVLSAIRTYRGTSPRMVGFGTLILQALPPD